MDAYSIARNSRRWPLMIFFVLLNISCVNSFVLCSQKQRINLKRHKFIKNVSQKLLEDKLKRRFWNIHPQKCLRTGIERILPQLQWKHLHQDHVQAKQKDLHSAPGQKTKSKNYLAVAANIFAMAIVRRPNVAQCENEKKILNNFYILTQLCKFNFFYQ